MTFEFQLLGLLLLFLLILVYYARKDVFEKGNKIYRGIIITSYLLQLVSVIAYVVNDTIQVFFWGYLVILMTWYLLFSIYFINILYRGKDRNFGVRSISYKTFIGFLLLLIIGALVVSISPLEIDKGMILYKGSIASYLILFYLMIEFGVLISGIKKIDRYRYISLFAIWAIQSFCFFLQVQRPEINFINIGIVLVSYYVYFVLENGDKLEIENLTLERNYALKQCIDKVDFLRVLSHEIRTPLNTIDGFSQVIADSDDIEEIKMDALDIRLASRDLIDVINGMIDLSIIESGSLEILKENYNVYDMFEEISNIIKSKIRDKEVEFKLEIADDIPEVLLGDSKRFSQVILNLLTNAVKYTDKGSISLNVDSIKSNTKCRLKVTVSDTGRGIKKEDIDTIFDTKVNSETSSLGLAVSRYLIELMGGMIEVFSEYGTGSKFVITLDQKIVSESNDDKVSHKRGIKPFDASGKRILLVDDNKLNLKVADRLLNVYGLEIVNANSGRECLDILDKDNNFDLILMDDLMPKMSGTECLDILKKIERVDGFYIPVVVLTANAVSGMKEKYLNVGFDDYLAKPIDKYELDRILKKYLLGKKK